MSDPLVVSALVCHRDTRMAATCLKSLLTFSRQPVRFVIHDDGSLEEQDLELLRAELNAPKVVSRKEADERMAEKLHRRPASLAFRNQSVFALKLLDAVYLDESDVYTYCDTDILFLRPFSTLHSFHDPSINAIFMNDLTESYSVRSYSLLMDPRLTLARKVNAGLIAFRRSHYDPELVEWFLSQRKHHLRPFWVEQTCWAMLGHQVGCHLWDPDQISLMNDALDESALVAIHFAGHCKGLIPHYAERQFRTSAAAIELGTVGTERCTPGMLSRQELKRVFRTLGLDILSRRKVTSA